MSDQLLLALKVGFFALLFMFVWRVVRLSARDLATPFTARTVAAPSVPKGTSDQRAAAPAAVPTTAPQLLVLSSPIFPPGTLIRLERTITFGRAPENDVVLEGDAYASSVHSEIAVRGLARVLKDRGSTNGTHVGGQPVTGEHELTAGDLVRIGETEMRFEP